MGEVLQRVGMEGERDWTITVHVYALYNHLAPCSLLSWGCGDGLSWQGWGSDIGESYAVH